MSPRTFFSSLLLSTSLLVSSACSTLRVDPASPDLAPGERFDRAKLRAALAARRAENIQRFLAYRENRVYPINDVGDGFQHVWLDSFGNLCAAATLISGDWGRDATARVALEDNLIALAGVHDGPLHDWVLTSGLTHHEIVAIQVPGWQGMRPDLEDQARENEIARLHALYIDVERQLSTMRDDSLDDAVDDLMARPELARQLLGGVAAGPGRYAPTPEAVSPPVSIGFATPPPG